MGLLCIVVFLLWFQLRICLIRQADVSGSSSHALYCVSVNWISVQYEHNVVLFCGSRVLKSVSVSWRSMHSSCWSSSTTSTNAYVVWQINISPVWLTSKIHSILGVSVSVRYTVYLVLVCQWDTQYTWCWCVSKINSVLGVGVSVRYTVHLVSMCQWDTQYTWGWCVSGIHSIRGVSLSVRNCNSEVCCCWFDSGFHICYGVAQS